VKAIQTLVLDIECYRNYFLVKFTHVVTLKVREYEMFYHGADDQSDVLNAAEIRKILGNYRIVTFNGKNYDLPMLTMALVLAARLERGETTVQRMLNDLKEVSDHIILGNMRDWQFEQHYDVQVPRRIDHIDLIEVAPGVMISLKQYGGRMHSQRLQDLPIEPSAHIQPDDRGPMRAYCGNDLLTTIDLWNILQPQITLRENMSKMYGLDLRSKSDAQIAEAVLKSEIEKRTGKRVFKPDIRPGTRYKFVAPCFIKFRNPELQQILADIHAADFVIGNNGQPMEPPALTNRTITIGTSVYRLGLGGLHSSETSVAHYADDETLLIDRDVASYYPSIIINCRLFPRHMGEAFLAVYKSILDRRITAKRSGDKVTADSLKITLNGTFGKLGSWYSVLYAPDLMLQVTITGQLALLMLIEALEHFGIPVVSANTDGIVIKCPKWKKVELDSCIAWWEGATKFETEETRYKALFSRDVNNYIALKEKGGSKAKGTFTNAGLMKNPQHEICNDAVAEFLEHGTPIEQTIIRCDDVRKFVVVRQVKGGGVQVTHSRYDEKLTPAGQRDFLLQRGWRITVPGPVAKCKMNFIDGDEADMDVPTAYRRYCGDDGIHYLGKVVRWVYAYGETGDIRYMKPNASGNRNKVAGSDGALPLMELPEHVPVNLDYGWYIKTAHGMLRDLGAVQ